MKIKNYQYVIILSINEFVSSTGRKPKNQEEFDDWCHYMAKGIEAQLDWDILGSCAADLLR